MSIELRIARPTPDLTIVNSTKFGWPYADLHRESDGRWSVAQKFGPPDSKNVIPRGPYASESDALEAVKGYESSVAVD